MSFHNLIITEVLPSLSPSPVKRNKGERKKRQDGSMYYKRKINILETELKLPWDIANIIVSQYLIPIQIKTIYHFLEYSSLVRKNFFFLKKCFRCDTRPIDSLENLCEWFDNISNYCTCPFCNINIENEEMNNSIILNRESCFTKRAIHKNLSKYFDCVPLYRRGSYEKYYSYIFRKLKGSRKHAKSNILKISKLSADLGISLIR
jgi:hypothetical protein